MEKSYVCDNHIFRPLRFAALLCAICALASLLCSCQWYVQGEVDRNTENLAKLRVGMNKAEVKQIMGEPLTNEVYNKPDVWFYYTHPRWQDGAATSDECTPVVFDEDGQLVGWGSQYYKANYEFTTWSASKKPAK